MAQKTVALIILDGWGIGEKSDSNPIHAIKPPQLKRLEENYPCASLQASGISVGLPWGETGNSEVGHLTLGAGKVIYQYYPRITMAIQDGTFYENDALKAACEHAIKNNSALNLVGILSDGNVHASVEHLEALIKLAKKENVPNLKLHLFADGKDNSPKSLMKLIDRVPRESLATLMGRYYPMDREERWILTEEAYNTLVRGNGTVITHETLQHATERTYAKGLTETFLPPLRFGGEEKNILDNEAVIFFNYREDSIRQIAETFLSPDFEKFRVEKFSNLFIATLTRYKDSFNAPVAFPPETVSAPLGKVISDGGKTQLRIAETYKYAHITFFFNCYHEQPFNGEYRVLIPSESIQHPDEHPKMMASAVTDRLVQALGEGAYDFILANYSNPDTIAHTGNYEAALEAVKTIDSELERVINAMKKDDCLIITSDHGNIEGMFDPLTGKKQTAHDPNPVPIYIVKESLKGRKFPGIGDIRHETIGLLSDVAPTVLELMGLEKPKEMTGGSLLKQIR